jgi:hypothetical protein
MPIGPLDTPHSSPPSYLPGCNTEPLRRTRHHRWTVPAGAPCLPLPLLEFKRHPSLQPHPVSPPVHAHCLADPPTHRNLGRRGRLPPSSPPAIAGVISGQIDATNRPRVSPIPPLAACTPEAGLLPPPASLCFHQGLHCRYCDLCRGICAKVQGLF